MYPKHYRSKRNHVWYADNIIVLMNRDAPKYSKSIDDVESVYINTRGQNREIPQWTELKKEAHAYERMYGRNFSEDDVLETLRMGYRLDQSGTKKVKGRQMPWTKRGKYIWGTSEVLVDETDPENWSIIQMHRNTRWEDKGFIDLIPKICREVKDLSTLENGIDISIDLHDKTAFQDRMLYDLYMHQAWLGIQGLEKDGQIDGYTDEQNEALHYMKKVFKETWGDSILWTVSSMSDASLQYLRRDPGIKQGIPADWLPEYRHIYYITITVYHRELIIPESVVKLLKEYGISVNTKGCTFEWKGPRGVDEFDRHVSNITLLPSGTNEWVQPGRYCNTK